MARSFDGSSFIIGGIGGLVGAPGGAHTIAVIAKRGTSGTDMVLVSLETSANSSKLAIEFGNTGNNLNLVIGSSSKDTNVDVTTTDNWVLAAVNRAGGTATPRGHKYVYDTGTWTHADASATAGGDSSDLTGGRIQLGRWQSTAHFNGDLAVAAVWKRSLADAEVEALAFSLQAWYTAAPDALWIVDQAATGTGVIDSTGLGANQTSITGTSVSTSSVPVFSYGFDSQIPSFVAGAAATNANAECATATIAANDSTTAVAPTAESVALTTTAGDAAASIGVSAEAVAVTATAQDPTASVAASAEAVSYTFTANDATVNTGGQTNANAECATWTAAAEDATTAVAPSIEVASATVAAGDGSASVAASAECATLTAASNDPVITLAIGVDVATIAWVAHNATVPGALVKATSTATVTAGRTSTAPVTAQRTSTPTVGG